MNGEAVLGSNRPKTSKPGKPAKPNRHGLNVMKSALKHLGNRAIDNRTRYGRALTEWRQGVCDDLGGRECVSVAQLQLIDTASRTKLLLDSVDNYLAELGGAIINKRDRKLFPIVQQRSAMADSLVRQLQAIGTERVIRRITSLSDLDD